MLLMLGIDVSFNLFIKVCMFMTFIIENCEGCSTVKLIVIGRSRKLEEAWLLVLAGRLYQSPSLALRSNLNPNAFFYSMLNPPTQPWCTSHQRFPLMPIAHILHRGFLHFQDSTRKCDLPIYSLSLSFSISHVHHIWKNWHSNLQVKSWTSSNYFLWFGDSSLSTLESNTQ